VVYGGWRLVGDGVLLGGEVGTLWWLKGSGFL